MKGIVEIIGDVVKQAEKELSIVVPADMENDKFYTVNNPHLNYIFGSARYIKDKLDEFSKTPSMSERKFPLIALFCPVTEKRDSPDYHSKVSLNIIIACSSTKMWSNERRLYASFVNILRPIYNRLITVLLDDDRFDIRYNDVIPHDYSENYSYGRYGAFTESGEEVSEPIDAINIRSMELIVKNKSCR
nr:MAG TPA: hypothetical protein [Siphoviridae sp. ctYIp7]